MIVGEYGMIFRILLDMDVSDYTTLKIVFTKPSGSTVTVDSDSNGVTVGTVDVTTDIGTFTANEYIVYTVEQSVIDEAGTWTMRAIYEASKVRRITKDITFTVVE